MIVLIAILYFCFKIAKEYMEDIELRENARQQGYNTYYGSRGHRNVSDDSKVKSNITYKPIKVDNKYKYFR